MKPTMILLAALMMLAPATATHVEPTTFEGPVGNQECSDFEAEGADWLDLKVDPPESGLFSLGDMMIDLTVDMNVESEPKTFNWSTDGALVHAVYVKAGDSAKNGGHNLYMYDPPASADTGLTSPGPAEKNAISHVTFCLSPVEVDCEVMPDHPECVPECPATSLVPTANGDGSISLEVAANVSYELWRAAPGENSTLLGSFDKDQDMYHDTDTEVGVSYTYTLIIDGEVCARTEVTSIPVFPSLLAGLVAIAVASVGYVALRRRP